MRSTGALGRDFAWLWGAYTVSAAGSALSAGALPLIAVTTLRASALQVSLLATVGGLASAVLALPLGTWIEHRRKRPVMVTADLIRCAASLSIPLAALAGQLSYWQLCVVSVVNTTAAIAFLGASGAHLKTLLPAPLRAEANSRMESAFWLTNSVGPPLGSALLGLFGSTFTLAMDGLSFLASAAGILVLRAPEPSPPPRPTNGGSRSDLVAGWRYLFAHPGLRPLFWNAMVFGGSVMLTAPLTAVLMLRELHFPTWQYGLVLGLPCLGGVLGAAMTGRITRRWGRRRVLLTFGVLRAPWLLLLPLAGPGPTGLAVLLLAETGLLVAAGVFNPTFVTYRMEAVTDGYMARVGTAWSISSKVAQPVFIAVGGLLAAVTDVRTALVCAGICCAGSAALMPWRGQVHADPSGAGSSSPGGRATIRPGGPPRVPENCAGAPPVHARARIDGERPVDERRAVPAGDLASATSSRAGGASPGQQKGRGSGSGP